MGDIDYNVDICLQSLYLSNPKVYLLYLKKSFDLYKGNNFVPGLACVSVINSFSWINIGSVMLTFWRRRVARNFKPNYFLFFLYLFRLAKAVLTQNSIFFRNSMILKGQFVISL